MSKGEAVLYVLLASALITMCHGGEGMLFEGGFVFAGILLGAVAWVVLNDTGENDE
jgi:hypothetical protein